MTKRQGELVAVMTIERRTSSSGLADSRGLRLVVTVAGRTVFDRSLCTPARCGPATQQRLSLHDLSGGSLPQVMLDSYSGGAHCCFATLVVLPGGPHAGRLLAHAWGDPGYALQRHDGRAYLVSADDRFAYAFTSFAASGLPVQAWVIGPGGAFTDVTGSRPDLVRADAARWWTAYTGERGRPDSDVRGVLGAWCADEDRLGLQRRCTAALASALAKGYLAGPGFWPEGASFVALLRRDLRAWGYPTG